ncbi:hypothetical protein [Salinigranum salinum]|nr:hypothetical protein [Salinigranum salinum]
MTADTDTGITADTVRSDVADERFPVAESGVATGESERRTAGGNRT